MALIPHLQGKRIILAVTGSIAVYKAADLASKLTQMGALVDVIMTESAQRFITPLTFQAVTGRAVYTDLWKTDATGALPAHIAHVGLGEGADLMLVAPATANTLAKLAHGFSDDMLSVTALAIHCPLVVAPAMDAGMYMQRSTQANVEILKSRGVTIIEPTEGRFASGLVGKGRLPEVPALIGHIRQIMGASGALNGRKVVITAGGTREALDPVRFITNHSSGKQGFALAQAAIDTGATVTLITSVQTLTLPVGVGVVYVDSAMQMAEAVISALADADALIMAAAVSDFRPATVAEQKIKKDASSPDAGLSLELVRNPDILLKVHQVRQETGFPRVSVGFAAESQDLIEHASDKLKRKGLDFIVANNILAPDAGFQSDTNRVVIIEDDGTQTLIELSAKTAISEVIIQKVTSRIASRDKA